MTTECIICNAKVENYEPQWCCNAYDCGCRGLVIEPPVCSEECWNKTIGRPNLPEEK